MATALTGKETLHVTGQYNGKTPSGRNFQTTTGDIAALGGGGGSGIVTTVESGTSYTTALTDTFVCWASEDTGAKNTYVRTNGMRDGQCVVIKDYFAFNYSQTIQALEVGVTIENQSSYTLTMANGVSVNLKFDEETQNLLVF